MRLDKFLEKGYTLEIGDKVQWKYSNKPCLVKYPWDSEDYNRKRCSNKLITVLNSKFLEEK